MSNIYQITSNWQTVYNMLYENEEIDEQLIRDTLESIEGDFEEKADNYAKIIKELLGDAEKIKVEKQRLEARQKSFENKAKLLKDTLQEAMLKIGKPKFKTELFSFNIQKNGGVLPVIIDDINAVPFEYFKHTEKELDNKKIRELIDSGEEISFAHYGEQSESLRIR